MKKNPELAAYMNCVAPEGLDLDSYVEHGACLLTQMEIASLQHNLADIRNKMEGLRTDQQLLAKRLEFLLSFYQADPPNLPDKVRRETAFALLYAAKEEDLVPDTEAGAGYLDDAAVAESVLSRHSAIFAAHCDYHGLEWSALKPVHAI